MTTELKNKDFVTKELANYSLPDAKLAELKAKYSTLKVTAIDDKENYELRKEAEEEALEKARIEKAKADAKL